MKPRNWTPAEVQRLLELREQSFHTEDIATLLGRTDQAVRLKLTALGFSSANPPRSVKTPAVQDSIAAPIEVLPPEEAIPTPAEPQELSVPPPALRSDRELDGEVREDLASARRALAASESRQREQRYAQLLRRCSIEERWLELFDSRFELFCPSPAAFHRPMPESQAGAGEAAVLLLSDSHVGQNVSSAQTGGFGDYNVRRYCERLAYLETRVLQLLGERAASTDELVVFLLGDVLHGVLSHGAEREETLLLADQFQLALWTLHQFLTRLAAAVPRVRIYTAVGNHGRLPTQRRMPTVGRYSNFDHLLYASLDVALRAVGRKTIDFQLNCESRQIVAIKGAHFHASHGDHLRGGDKQTGLPLAAIGREVSMTAQRHAASDRPRVDYFLIGDKHKCASLPLPTGSFIVNGSFVGADEFSAFNFPPSEPSQLLFWVHPTLGKTWQHEIKLQPAPRLQELPYELPRHIQYLVDQYGEEGGPLPLCA